MARKPHFELFDKGNPFIPGRRFRVTFHLRGRGKILTNTTHASQNEKTLAVWLSRWLNNRDDVDFEIQEVWARR